MSNRFAAFTNIRWPTAVLGIVLLLVASAFGAIEAVRLSLESDYRKAVELAAMQRAMEITMLTMNGNVMGAVATLGLVHHPIKKDALDLTPAQAPAVMEALEASGKMHQANGIFVVGTNGIVRSSWSSVDKPTTGLNLKFRSYIQSAMQGKQNVYAAVSMASGKRALFFAAPLYSEVSTDSPVIGATVARMGPEQIESVLKTWLGPALLLSSQKVTFASNRSAWVEYMSETPTPEKLKAIRALKQFGKKFETEAPKVLPFDIGNNIVTFENHRYVVSKAPVQWNDPNGEWTLVLLGNLDELMPPALQAKIGAATSVVVLTMYGILLFWRRRLQRSEVKRRQAEAELNNYTHKLETESSLKTRLAQISTELQQTGTLAEFTRIFLFHTAPLLDVEYGIFYVLNEENRQLTPLGGYGVVTDGLDEIAIGQGLVGLCARDLKPIVIAPPDGCDIHIAWGLGEIMPKAILIQPVVQTGRLLGVIELAALRPLSADQKAMLETLTPMVAMNLEILLRNLSTLSQAEALQKQQTHLQETETWYRGIIESAPDGLLVTDDQGTILLANPQIESLFGYEAGDVIGQNIEVLVPPSARTQHAALRQDYMQSGGARAMGGLNKELHGIRRDGTEFPVEVGLSKLAALGGHGVCVCVSVRDISLRRKVEDVERFNRLALGREQRIIDLKRQINTLALELGRPAVYNALDERVPDEQVAESIDIAAPAQARAQKVLELGELVDLGKLQALFSNFCESVGVAAAIIDLEGKVLASSRWQRACTDFHRINKATCARCIESDTGLALKLKDGEDFTMYKCKNGMTDCASPIIVESRHLANVFIGQFHVGQPDMGFFRNQAKQFAFPQEDYLKAIAEAPVLDEKKLPIILGFLSGFTKMITSLSIERRRADIAQHDLQQRADELSRQRAAAISLAEDAESARTDLLRLTALPAQAN